MRPEVHPEPRQPSHSESQSFHGGKSFEEIGVIFDRLERAHDVVSADVLDAWFDPSPQVLQKIAEFLPFLARTSPPVCAAGLIQTIARQRGVSEESLLVGGGSSDLIFACLPHLIKPGGKALLLDPMYGEYRYLLSTAMNVDLARFPLARADDYAVQMEAIIADVIGTRPDLVVIVNPNSPTGQHWPRSQITRFLDTIPESATVILDETYIEYVGAQESLEQIAAERPNVVVIKSMSKVYALSGLRVGYLVAHPSTIRRLAVWIPPWSVSLPAQLAAIEALGDPLYYQDQYDQTALLRQELTTLLHSSLLIRIYPSQTNFLLIETVSSAEEIVRAMGVHKVFVRNCDSMSERFQDRFIRIAVKSRGENERIAETLRTVTMSSA